MRRSDQRRDAVFAGYQHDVTGRPLDELLGRDARPFTRALAEGTLAARPELDAEITRLSRGWSIDRIAPLERNILRVGLYELRHREDIPAEVAIDEAVGIAKRFCGARAPSFVNGILAASAGPLPGRDPDAALSAEIDEDPGSEPITVHADELPAAAEPIDPPR